MVIQVFYQTISLFLMASVGYICAKTGLVDDRATLGLSNIIIKVAMPATIIAFASVSLTPERIQGIFWISGFGILFYPITLCLFSFIANKTSLPPIDKKVFFSSVVFANVGFMGFPFIFLLFGDEGLFYGAIFNVVFNLYLFTVGINLMASEDTKPKADNKFIQFIKIFSNPVVIAAFIMIFVCAFQIKFPAPVQDTLNKLGAMTTPLSLFIVGTTAAKVKLSKLFTQKFAYVVALLRLVVCPIAIAFILYLIKMPPMIACICVIVSAMPTGSLLAILSNQYKMNSELTIKTIATTSLLLIVSMPLVMWVLNMLFVI